MNKAAKNVSSAIVGADFELIEVAGLTYVLKPPTINGICGAVACLSKMALDDGATLKDILLSNKDAKEYAKALSFLVNGNYELADELAKGTYDEIIGGLLTAFDMMSAKSFSIAASLTKSASALVARATR